MNYVENARAYRRKMEAAAQYAPDNVALSAPELYPAWESGKEYRVDEIIRYDGELYRIVQLHLSQPDWLPEESPALYKPIRFEGDIVAWSQPTGAHDAYGAGDVVSHNGKVWVSEASGNVWEPGVYGWSEKG